MRNLILTLFCLVWTTLLFAQQDTTKSKVSADSLKDMLDQTPTLFTTSADELENESQSQDISGLLTASRDVYTSPISYNLSAARFRIRGYGSENLATSVNGVVMNNPENGWSSWWLWGGLNDMTRYKETMTGVSPSHYSFGGIGGFSNIELRASAFQKGARISYANSNRSYDHRVIATYNTGVMKNGFAVSISGSMRYANEGYVEGTYYNGWSGLISIEKKLSKKHSIGLIVFDAPTEQGRNGIATQETYDLAGTNYYNPYWGYQAGKKRNARVRKGNTPVAMLSDYFTINKKAQLNTVFTYMFGKQSYSGLDWYDAKDPRPDYYKNLPSYNTLTNPDLATQLTNQWKNNESQRQINWDDLYNANYKNLYTVHNVDGISGNNVTGNRSKYILGDRNNDPTMYNFTSTYTNKATSRLMITAGLNVNIYKDHHYESVEDLLGGDYWVDVDQFAEQEYNSDSAAQNNLTQPNHIVKAGDKYGYNYYIHVNKYNLFGQAEYHLRKVNFYVGLTGTQTSFWRDGVNQNGIFPENSKGKSKISNFTDYGVKGGIVYKLTGRHLFTLNGTYETSAPYADYSFISPDTRNDLVNNLKSKTILSGDANYILSYPHLKIRATYYYTEVNNDIWMHSYYDDALRTYVNYSMTGVDELYNGVELGIEQHPTTTITLNGALGYGQYLYNSRPTATITQDNSAKILATDRTIYLKNYHIGGMPELGATAGAKYRSPKYWFVGANFNYFGDNYLPPNPDRRTAEALTKYVESDPQWNQIIDETKLKDGYTIDLYAGKSWKIKKYIININVSVSNILNTKDIIIGGYEQLRYNANDINEFPPKYSYMYGRTYYAQIALRF